MAYIDKVYVWEFFLSLDISSNCVRNFSLGRGFSAASDKEDDVGFDVELIDAACDEFRLVSVNAFIPIAS